MSVRLRYGGPSSAGIDRCALCIPRASPGSDNEDTMDEQRKHALLFAATLLCARKLLPLMESDEPKPAQEFLTEHFRWRAAGSDLSAI